MTHPAPPTLGLVLAGGLARRMGGGDKALHPHRRRAPSSSACSRGLSAAMRAASSSTPMAIRRASPIPACRSSPTACRISPARSPAFSPGSTGRRRTRPASNGSLSVPGDCPFLPRDLVGAAACGARGEPARRSPARARATGAIRWSGCGRSRCATICAARWSTRTCARSRSGPRATASRIADWPATPVDPFFNVNTPEDVAEAERIAAQYRDAVTV